MKGTRRKEIVGEEENEKENGKEGKGIYEFRGRW